jgi:hypothetical protein
VIIIIQTPLSTCAYVISIAGPWSDKDMKVSQIEPLMESGERKVTCDL